MRVTPTRPVSVAEHVSTVITAAEVFWQKDETTKNHVEFGNNFVVFRVCRQRSKTFFAYSAITTNPALGRQRYTTPS